jgi:type II secretory pathway component PulC
MKVSSINLLCWLTSASLTFGLAAYCYDFLQRREDLEKPYDKAYVGQVLNETIAPPEEVKEGVDYRGQVVPIFHNMNWTGKPDPKVIPKGPETTQPLAVQHKPVSDLLSIIYVQVDTDDPGASKILVLYKGELASQGDAELRVGSTLPKPHDYAAVHQIRADRIEFTFTGDDGRENESIGTDAVDEEVLIHVVADGQVITPNLRAVPQARERVVQNPAKTQLIAANTWQLGTEDVSDFAENYQRILTHDVRTKTHYDENGRRDGVEITEVRDDSIVARHGVKSGDVFISINGHPVTSEQEAIKFVKNNADKYTVWEVVMISRGRRVTKVFRNPEE